MKAWLKDNCGWPMTTVLASSFLLVYALSPEWIRKIPGMNSYLDLVPTYLPGIGKYISVSKMPEIASVYFPLMAALSLLTVLEVWRLPARHDRWFTNFWAQPYFNMFRIVLVALFFSGTVWAGYWKGGAEIEALSVRDSRFNLALLGSVYAGVAVWGFFGILTRATYSIFQPARMPPPKQGI